MLSISQTKSLIKRKDTLSNMAYLIISNDEIHPHKRAKPRQVQGMNERQKWLIGEKLIAISFDMLSRAEDCKTCFRTIIKKDRNVWFVTQ